MMLNRVELQRDSSEFGIAPLLVHRIEGELKSSFRSHLHRFLKVAMVDRSELANKSLIM